MRARAQRGRPRERADRAAARDLPRPGHRGARPRAGRGREGAEGEPLRLHAAAWRAETHRSSPCGPGGIARKAPGVSRQRCSRSTSATTAGLAAGAAGAGAARIEVTETLPKALRQAHADVMAVADDDAAKQKAAALLADGERAIRARDRAAMTKISADLTALRDELDPRIHAHHRIAPRREHRRVAPTARRQPGAQLLSDRRGP